MKQTIRRFRAHYWRLSALILGIILASALLFGWHLGSLTRSVSNEEIQTLASYSSLHAIINNPLHAPLKLVAWALWHIPVHTPATLRAPFALFAVLSLVAFAYVLKRWYGIRLAVLGVCLFATSSWLLHVGRIALFDVSFLWAGVTLLALHVLFHAHSDRRLVRFTWLIGMLILLFVPGMVWLVLANIALQRDDLAANRQDIDSLWEKIAQPVLVVLALAGIGFLVYLHPRLGLDWLGAPHDWSDWQGMLKRLVDDAAYLVARGPQQPLLWLGRLPVLDAFSTVMLIAGSVFYARHRRSFRTLLLGSMSAVAALLIAISPVIHFSLLVPFTYAIIVGGMAFILHQWLKVFPRNPLARSLGIGLIAILVLAASAYNLRSYFVAWPHNTDTRAAFTAILPGK